MHCLLSCPRLILPRLGQFSLRCFDVGIDTVEEERCFFVHPFNLPDALSICKGRGEPQRKSTNQAQLAQASRNSVPSLG